MVDYGTAILQGLFTGIGVILAQWLMNWIDRHPLMVRIKQKAEDLTKVDSWRRRKR